MDQIASCHVRFMAQSLLYVPPKAVLLAKNFSREETYLREFSNIVLYEPKVTSVKEL